MVLGTFLTAQSTKYWHFIICQGVLVGVNVTSTLLSTIHGLINYLKAVVRNNLWPKLGDHLSLVQEAARDGVRRDSVRLIMWRHVVSYRLSKPGL